MTRVFAGERTLLSPVLRPVERVLYRLSGVDETAEQHWVSYAIAMLAFTFAGFVSLYALQRLQTVLPFNPRVRMQSGRTWRSTPRSASSPTPTGNPTYPKRP